MLAIALAGGVADADGTATGAVLDGRVAGMPVLDVLALQAVFVDDGAGTIGAAVVEDLTAQAVLVRDALEDATVDGETGERVVEGVTAGITGMVEGTVASVVLATGAEETGRETAGKLDEEAMAEVAGLVAVTRVVGAGADPPDPAAQTATGPPGAT